MPSLLLNFYEVCRCDAVGDIVLQILFSARPIPWQSHRFLILPAKLREEILIHLPFIPLRREGGWPTGQGGWIYKSVLLRGLLVSQVRRQLQMEGHFRGGFECSLMGFPE